MIRPDEPDPNAYTLRSVLAGEPYSRAVEGGVRRTPAPSNGLVVVLADREVFLDRNEVRGMLDLLDRRSFDDGVARALAGQLNGGKRR